MITFPLPTALLERLRLVGEGAEVLIQYTGLQTSKAGRTFKGFEVFVAEEGSWSKPVTPLPLPSNQEA